MDRVSGALNLQDDPDARAYLYTDSQLMVRMTKYLLRYRGQFAVVAVLVAVSIALNVMIPFVLRRAIDVDFGSGDLSGLLLTATLYVVLQLFAWLCTYGTEYLSSQIGQSAVYDVRQQLYSHLQKLSQDFYDKSASGRVVSRLTNDIDRMSELLAGGLIGTFAQVFVVFAIGAVVFTVDTQLAFVSVSIVPVLLLVTLYFRRVLKEAFRSTRKTISSVTSDLAESIAGAKVTKSFARERVNVEHFDSLIRADYDANVDAGRSQATFFPSIRFISAVGVFLILWFGGLRLMEGTMTLGTVVLFISFNEQFFRPILTIANFYAMVQSAFAGAERVFGIIDTEPSVKDAPDAQALREVRGHIRFSQVNFSYVEGIPVLRDFNLEIQPGETVAIVGETGAGKSTVVNLLTRLYEVNSGSIEIDGVDIRKVSQDSLHAAIGLVLQDSFLFMGTVRDNIKYGRPDASDAEVLAAIDAIGARRVFDGLQNGIETEVGERGGNLSEGERQLVSFARTVIANPRILVLDEATSSVDIYTEYAIQRGLRELLKDRTSVVIAHRLSTIVQADRIIVMDQGRIVESGTHSELMKRRGKYYALYELQIQSHSTEAMSAGKEAQEAPSSRT
ncbi:MAG: ABC transporter ATP-binding protein [Candidatus Thorarchaeota archaeon]|nr:ABC transporter ATP-binding protein [Candidatus Thorarchaeota archaeon]